MKRILAVLLCFVICASLSSCVVTDKIRAFFTPPVTDVNTDVNTEDENELATEKEEPEVFGLNESAVLKDIKITATDIAESYGGRFNKPDDGNIFVGVEFEIENISEEVQRIRSDYWSVYVDDVKYSSSYQAKYALQVDEKELEGAFLPGKKIVGWKAIEIPENWNKIELYFYSEEFSTSYVIFTLENTK